MSTQLDTLRVAYILADEAHECAQKWRLFHDNADSGWDRDKVDHWRKIGDGHRATCAGLRGLIYEEERRENVRMADELRAVEDGHQDGHARRHRAAG